MDTGFERPRNSTSSISSVYDAHMHVYACMHAYIASTRSHDLGVAKPLESMHDLTRKPSPTTIIPTEHSSVVCMIEDYILI